ncbi:MAG: response regulator [Bacteroidota bacterium]
MKKLAFPLLFSLQCLYVFAQGHPNLKTVTREDDIRQDIESLLDSSNVHYFKGNYIKSLEFNVELLEKALKINDPKFTHQGYRLLGYDYLVLNDTVLARESFEKSSKYARITKNDTAIAQTSMDLANLYSEGYSNWNKALSYHDESIRLFKKIKDSSGLSKAHFNTILTCIEAGQVDKALIHLNESLKYKAFHNESVSIALLNQWGTVYRLKKEYERANTYFEKVILMAQDKGYPVELADAYKEYSESLFEQQRFQESFDNRKKYEQLLVENMSTLQNTESESVSAKFQLAEYKKDVALAEKENQLQQEIVNSKSRLNNILIVVSICGLIMFTGLWVAFRKRKQLVSQLKERNKKYLEAKFRSEHLAKAKSKFFSTVSHELRTPLYGVIGLSTILLEDESLQKHKKDLTSLKFSADYLLALINDVLQINKIDSNSLEDDITTFNIRDLVQSIASSFEYMRLQNKNEIHIEVSEEIPTLVNANSIRLSQILMNLVGNACKFTENGDIYIRVEALNVSQEKAKIRFSVRDTGIGISKNKQAHIFDEFAQVESLDYSYQGTGLGLPIVKKLLALSNSKIYLDSDKGKGSTFSFELDLEVSHEIKTKEDTALLDISLLKDKNILIAEDNRINQIVTQKILERNHMNCSIAQNGEEAVALAKENAFDLVLMDLNMPKMNGVNACIEIRKFNTTLPIIALTAVEVEEVRNEIQEAGMNDIIVKPYDVTLFLRTLLVNLGAKGLGVVNSNKRRVAI